MLSERYNDLFVPLAKAVQQLKVENESLQKANAKTANIAVLKKLKRYNKNNCSSINCFHFFYKQPKPMQH
jgi:hypothetical protein